MRRLTVDQENQATEPGSEPEFEVVELTAARARLADLFNRAAYGKERLALSRHGKVLAALVPIEDARLLEEMEDRLDLEKARAALAEAQGQEAVPWEQVKAELGL
jgi:prevent-host-death family protein